MKLTDQIASELTEAPAPSYEDEKIEQMESHLADLSYGLQHYAEMIEKEIDRIQGLLKGKNGYDFAVRKGGIFERYIPQYITQIQKVAEFLERMK